jgi:hypothetical protein
MTRKSALGSRNHLVLLVCATHDNLQGVVRQWSLEGLASSQGARIQMQRSSSVVRIDAKKSVRRSRSPSAPPPDSIRQERLKIQSFLASSPTLRGAGLGLARARDELQVMSGRESYRKSLTRRTLARHRRSISKDSEFEFDKNRRG